MSAGGRPAAAFDRYLARDHVGGNRSGDTLDVKEWEQRAGVRAEIALPILIALGGVRYSALLHNLSTAGAMIATIAPLAIRSRIEFHCGSICTSGFVLRQGGSKFGVKFLQPITDRQLSEQISRSDAVASRRGIRALIDLTYAPPVAARPQ